MHKDKIYCGFRYLFNRLFEKNNLYFRNMILVTGGTGLVGAHLLLQLIESKSAGSEKVRAIYRKEVGIQKTKALFELYKKSSLLAQIEWIQADITDIPSLELAFLGITTVYHCAALISFDPKEEAQLRKINIEGTANIVNFSIAYGVQKLCYVSSIATLGDPLPHENFITETTEWNPENYHSDYAISKYGAEMEVWRGQQEGLSVIIINPGVILGPVLPFKDWENGSGQLLTKVKRGLPFYTLGTSGFIAVIDVVQIAQKLTESDITNERFTLIASNITFKEVLDTMAESLNTSKPRWHATPFIMKIIWRLDWISATIFGQKRRISRASAMASYNSNLYSNQKIKNALTIKFTDIKAYIKHISKL